MRDPIDLYGLLPAVHRLRDAEAGEPLRALVDLVSEQAELLRSTGDGMWDDLFVETAAEWLVPYIGDLVGNTPLYKVPGVGRRADVAETIAWRRRKGTLSMLGDLARAVTGWGAHAVATFELLGWNQNLNHQRMQDALDGPAPLHPFAQDRVGTLDVRSRDVVDRVGGAFETATHTVDVRRIADDTGWYGIRKVAFFVFRLQAFPLHRTTPRRAAGQPARCLHLHPLGQDAPLFHLGTGLEEEQAFATEINVDAPIRPYRFYEHPELDYGPGRSLHLHCGGVPVPRSAILCKDLSGWPAVPPDRVAIDVRRGRVRFGADYPMTAPVRVDHTYGFSAPIGAGPYLRDPLPELLPAPDEITVSADGPIPTIEAAVALWKTRPVMGLRIVIADSTTYELAGGTLALDRPAATMPIDIELVAADGQRPVIEGDLTLAGTPVDRLVFGGVVLSGQLSVAGPVDSVTLSDCTLVPGIALTAAGAPASPSRPSLLLDQPPARRDVLLERTITGPIRAAEEANHLVVRDGIVDAPAGAAAGTPRVAIAADDAGTQAGPETTLERCTVFGAVRARQLTLVSESIVAHGGLVAERRQVGCVRFSAYEPASSATPKRYRCQPDLAVEALGPAATPAEKQAERDRVRPAFTTARYGQPAYAQLGRTCAAEVREGAEDRSEMGAFHLLLQPQRETNLRVRLDEYLPFGLEPGIIHIT